jgi:hypothetical protein
LQEQFENNKNENNQLQTKHKKNSSPTKNSTNTQIANEKDKNQELTSGGDHEQDKNELKFQVTLRTIKTIQDKKRFESKTELHKQITNNFKYFRKKIVGPITGFLRNNREIVLTGERESDHLLFTRSQWLHTIFDNSGIEKCIDLEPNEFTEQMWLTPQEALDKSY